MAKIFNNLDISSLAGFLVTPTFSRQKNIFALSKIDLFFFWLSFNTKNDVYNFGVTTAHAPADCTLNAAH